jgi:HEAT repeat protein
MRSPLRRASIALLLGLGALACHSSGSGERDDANVETEPFVPLPDEGPESIGFFLTQFDRSLQKWSELKLSAASTRDQGTLAALERSMEERATKRRDELLVELESGAPLNRRIAAAALGFTHDPTVLPPLLAVLTARDPELVQKALLALGVLALPETPVAEIRQRLLNDPDAWTRNNAAFALLALARAGSTSVDLVEGCRAALIDTEPGVRAQCASALGVLSDEGSIPQLAELLHDEANLAGLAAAAALARIGREHPPQKGTTARALANALDEVSSERRHHILGALRWLADTDLGADTQAWREWAYKLP